MRISALDVSQARTASDDVVRGLEALDETACIIHLGGPEWLVGKLRPNRLVEADAIDMLDRWTAALRSGKQLSERGRQRVRFALLARLGVRTVGQYRIQGDPDGRIVQDFERSRYIWLHTRDTELFQQIDDAEAERQARGRNDVASIDRAKDAWQYAFTRSHRMGTSLTPEIRPRAGWTREMTIPAFPTLRQSA